MQQEKASRTSAQRKLDSQFVYALRQKKTGLAAPGLAALKPALALEQDRRVLVDIDANVSPALLEFIGQNGGLVISSFPRARAIRARITLELAELLANRADISYLRPADLALTNTGRLPTQGDVAHRADQAPAQ